MRTITLTVTAIAAALVLTACDDNGGGGGDKGSGSACQVGGVSVQIGAAGMAPAAGDTGDVPVSITNQSAACTLDGFAEVELTSDGHTEKVPALSGAHAQKLKLAKGDSASFSISYVRGKSGDTGGLAAKKVEITLPGSGTTKSFPWTYGPLAEKAGSKTPDASVSAFQQVGD